MLRAFPDPIGGLSPAAVSRRRVLTGGGRGLLVLAVLGSALGSTTVACGRSGPPGPDPLEAQLKAARRDSEMATAAAKVAPPPAVPALTVIAAERSRHAGALVEELSRAAGKPIPNASESQTPSSAPATPSAGAKPPAPPSVNDVAKALRESADSAAKLAPTLSGYRAGLLGSIAAACATSLAVGFNSTERHR
ncbi:MAG: hypothetical protein ACOYBX_15680 [Mycobacterium sp.]